MTSFDDQRCEREEGNGFAAVRRPRLWAASCMVLLAVVLAVGVILLAGGRREASVIGSTLLSGLLLGGLVLGMVGAAVFRTLAGGDGRFDGERRLAVEVMDTVREPLIVLDGALRVRSANPSFYRMFQAAPEETEGRPLYDLGNGQWDVPALRTLLEEVLPRNSQFNDYEVEHDFPMIGRRVMLLNARRLRRTEGLAGHILLAIEDVTDRRRGDRENVGRLQAARLLAAIIESSEDAIVSKSLDGVIQSWNAAAERLFGYRAEEAIGRHITLIIPPERAAEEDQIIARIRAGVRVEHFDTIRVRKDGSPVHVSLTISPVNDDAGRVVGASKIARDVSDRIAAERNLRESEERGAFVRRASGVGFWYCDLPFDVLQWDERVKAHFHLPPDASVTIQTFYDRMHPDDREPTRRAIDQSIADHGLYDAQFRTIHPETGAVKWVRAIGRTFYDDGGVPLRFDGVTLDVTASRQAEAALKEARGFLHATLDALSSHIAVLDESGSILEVNATWRDFPDHGCCIGGGVSVGANYVDVCRAAADRREDAGRAVEGLREVMAGRLDAFSMEYPCHSPDERRWFLMRLTRFREGGKLRIVVSHEPITMIKQAEEKLRQSEERFRTLVEQVEEHAIFGTDVEGRPTTWNEGVRKVLGFEEWEFVGRDVEGLIFTPEDVEKGILRKELETAAEGGSSSDDRWMLRKDGARFWAAGITTARRDDQGRLIGFTKVMRDMTAQKEMESELRQLAADLSEADRRKDEFLAVLAHELRNPLAPIRNGLRILRLADGVGAELDGPIGMMERQLGQLVRLVDDLLDVSRISRGKLTLHKERVPLALVVEQAVETSRPLIDAGGHRLTLDAPDEPIFVDVDVTRLAQVLSNLLNNAAKYMERGGRIALVVERRGDEAVIRVRDQGVGIPAPMLPRVFDLFTQVDRSLEKAQGGLGIGLTLVKQLVDMHGGSVEAHSGGPGEGSEFVVRLALAQPPAAAAVDRRPPAAAGGLRVLVADDNRDSASSLSMLLSMLGNEVHTAHDGQEAFEAAERFRPDVALLDIGMPLLNGYEVCRRIRERPWGRDMVVVALTGWGQDDDRRKSREAGFTRHVVKPLDPAALEGLLAESRPEPA